MRNILSAVLVPLAAAMLSACGSDTGPASTGTITPPGGANIAVGEPSPSGPVVPAGFISMARDASCADQRNRLFVIDRKLVLWDRAGNCADASYARVLYGAQPSIQLCSSADSIAGPRTGCTDESKRALFDTMLKNLDKADLGLGAEHKVEELTVLPKDGTTLAFDILWESAYSAIDDERKVVVTDAAAFVKLWDEAHLNLSSLHPAPKIDFSKKMVVGVFTGKQLNGCRSVTIGRTGIEGGKLAVEYDLGLLVETALCVPQYTSPGTLAVLDRVDAQAQFSRIQAQPLAYTRLQPNLDASRADNSPATAVVKDAAAWAQLWTRYSTPGAPLPAVDFSKSMVLFAFYGESRGCDSKQLESVARVNGKLYVTSSYTPASPRVACIAIMTVQSAMVTVERSDEPVLFISKRLPAPTR